MLIGFRNRLVVLINWAWNYLTYDRGLRAILGPVTPPPDDEGIPPTA
jgi:NADH:ubiquinone reductase (H+-translocating)